MLTFNEVHRRQSDLQMRMGFPNGFGEIGASENLFAAMMECAEAINELNWKKWKAEKNPVDKERFATELTDIIQFVFNAAACLELDEYDLATALIKKWDVNDHDIKSGVKVSKP